MDMDRISQLERRKSIAKGYEMLSQRKTLDNTGIWGYLKSRNPSTSLPNEHRGVVTCSHDEYMQLYLKDKRKKSQVPSSPQTMTDLSIDLSRSTLSRSKSSHIDLDNNTGEDVLLKEEECLDSERDLDNVRLDGQKIKSEHDLTRKKSHSRKKDGDQSLQVHHNSKKKRDKKNETPDIGCREQLVSPKIIYESTERLDTDITENNTSVEKNTNHDSCTQIEEIELDENKKSHLKSHVSDNRRGSHVVNANTGSLPAVAASNSQLLVKNDERLAHSYSSGSAQSTTELKSIWQNAAKSYNGNIPVESVVSENRRSNAQVGTQSTPRSARDLKEIWKNTAKSHGLGMVPNGAGASESRRGTLIRSSVRVWQNATKDRGSKLATNGIGHSDSRRGSHMPAPGDSRRGSHMPGPGESRRGSVKPVPAESRRGSHMPAPGESRRGSVKPVPAESRRGSNVHILGEQGTLLAERRKSIKGDQLRRKSIRLQSIFIESEENLQEAEQLEEPPEPPTPIVPLLGPEKVRILWQWAFNCVLRTNKLQNVGSARQKMTAADRKDSDIRLSTYTMEDIERSIKIKKIFSKKKSLSDEDFSDLNSILGTSSFFQKFPQDLRPRLYNELFYATYAKGKKLIKELNQAEFCYILILGEAIQYSETNVSRINDFGSTVGEFLSATPSEPRNYSVICLMQTTLLYIPKQVWIKYTREAKQYEAYQLEALSNLNFFKSLQKSELVKICARGSIRYYNPATFIINAGESSDCLYFIIKGKVQIMHLLEFIKGIDPFVERSYMISAFNGQVNQGDELVKELVPLLDLVPGNFFPPLEPIPSICKSNLLPWSYISGETIVEAFMIPKIDLLELIPESLLSDLQTVRFFPTRESLVLAQDRYLFLHGWVGAVNDLKISERISSELVRRNITFENYCKQGQ